jgi:hypothetical protein
MKREAMDENLVGYLLKALDAESTREVETYLRTNPDERNRLEMLRRVIAPLASDVDDEPPPGLSVRTIARVAEYQCHKLPPAPPPAPAQVVEAPILRSWRWADVLIAASILLCLFMFLPLFSYRVWRQYQQYTCANNLHKFHDALMRYADNHDGELPRVEAFPSARSVAGIFVPILKQEGYLDKDVSVSCSPLSSRPPTDLTVDELQSIYDRNRDDFRARARGLSGCYAYTLGYLDGAGVAGLRRGIGDKVPVMADCPPVSPSALLAGANSPNHGGQGQNVLFLDGAVSFRTTRFVGHDDDIYLNQRRLQEAGLSLSDSVLGPSASTPKPGWGDE